MHCQCCRYMFCSLPCSRSRRPWFIILCLSTAVNSGEDSGSDDNVMEETSAAAKQADSAAEYDASAPTSGRPDGIGTQPFSLPKQIHSAASLVSGVSSRLTAAPSQSEATQDPMRLSTDPAQVWDQAEIGRASVPHDQAHWQDDYATNWDRVGMGRNASPSDAAAAAMQQVSCPSGLNDDSHAKSGKGRAWACKLCTFAANPSHSIRCEVCDTVRGSTLQDYRPPTADGSMSDRVPSQLERLGSTDRQCALVIPSKKQNSKHSQHSIARFLGCPNPTRAESDSWTSNTADSRKGSATVHHEKSAVCSAWTRVEFDTEVRWQCSKCKCCLQTEQKAEHEDYHLALDLQHQSTAVQQTRTLSGHEQSKRHKSCKAAY